MEVLASRVLLRPTDLERSIAFYRDAIGLHVFREYGTATSRGVVFFLGGGYLELSGQADVDDGSQWIGLWLQVRDAATCERELRSAGVEVHQPARRMPWGLVELEARDPDGVRLVFVEVPDDHPLRRRLD